jgi:hypothetical protein
MIDRIFGADEPMAAMIRIIRTAAGWSVFNADWGDELRGGFASKEAALEWFVENERKKGRPQFAFRIAHGRLADKLAKQRRAGKRKAAMLGHKNRRARLRNEKRAAWLARNPQ